MIYVLDGFCGGSGSGSLARSFRPLTTKDMCVCNAKDGGLGLLNLGLCTVQMRSVIVAPNLLPCVDFRYHRSLGQGLRFLCFERKN